MSTVTVSEYWLEGFAKAAEQAGISPERVPELLKIASRRQLQKISPDAFQAGFDEVAKQAGAGSVIGGILLGALGLKGIQAGVHAGSEALSDMTLANRLNRERQDWAKGESQKAQIQSVPGHAPMPRMTMPGMPMGSGMGLGYGTY